MLQLTVAREGQQYSEQVACMLRSKEGGGAKHLKRGRGHFRRRKSKGKRLGVRRSWDVLRNRKAASSQVLYFWHGFPYLCLSEASINTGFIL